MSSSVPWRGSLRYLLLGGGTRQAPATVLDGVYTTAQAERGVAVYETRCSGATRGRMRMDRG